MRNRNIFLLSAVLLMFGVIGCGDNKSNEKGTAHLEEENAKLKPLPAMSAELIDAERQRIESIQDWKDIRNVDLKDSAARGKANYYYIDNHLAKIVSTYFGEMQQNIRKFYVLNGHLIYAVEQQIKYNRPIYYDTTLMRIEEDTVTFDLDKSLHQTSKFYFNNQQAVKIVKDSIPVFDPSTESAHAERLIADFERLVNLQTQ